jgi:hypothetical protein
VHADEACPVSDQDLADKQELAALRVHHQQAISRDEAIARRLWDMIEIIDATVKNPPPDGSQPVDPVEILAAKVCQLCDLIDGTAESP